MKGSRVIATTAFVVVALVAITMRFSGGEERLWSWSLSHATPVTAAPSEPAPAANEQREPDADGDRGLLVQPAVTEVNRAPNTPQSFGQVYADLVSAAERGDRSAKIALARGLAACSDRSEWRNHYGELRSRAERLTRIASAANADEKAKQAMDRAILAMDDTKRHLDAKEISCAGVPETAIRNRWHQQLAAADTGDADMIVDFVTHPAVDPREAFEDDSGVRAYRENAPRLLERLIQSGDLRGYQAYVRAGYDKLMRRDEYRFHDALSRVLQPDPIRVLAYDIAIGQSGLRGAFGSGPDHDALRNRQLDPAQRLAAEAMAREIEPDVAAAVARWLAQNPPRP